MATTDSRQDIGIATFLMLLWRDMYPAFHSDKEELWGRPPGGFVDMGLVAFQLPLNYTLNRCAGVGQVSLYIFLLKKGTMVSA